jgi:hypothetical protein
MVRGLALAPGLDSEASCHMNRPNHAMERTSERRMTRLKEKLRIMKQTERALVRRRSSCSR